MFDKLDIFRVAGGMASHAASRLSVIAQNVANADTPGYRARDLDAFSQTYRSREGANMRASRPGHLPPGDGPLQTREPDTVYRPGAAAPNGNSVSLESEMMMAAEVKSEHDRALAIYQKSLDILRTSLGRSR